MTEGEKPVRRFRAGSVRASIWQNEEQDETGEVFTVFNVKVDRSYKDAEGNWQSAVGFRARDLADLEMVLFKAREFASLKEEDPAEE